MRIVFLRRAEGGWECCVKELHIWRWQGKWRLGQIPWEHLFCDMDRDIEA